MSSLQRPSREGLNQTWGSHQSFSSQDLMQLALSADNTPTAENAPSLRGVSGYHDDELYDRGMSSSHFRFDPPRHMSPNPPRSSRTGSLSWHDVVRLRLRQCSFVILTGRSLTA